MSKKVLITGGTGFLGCHLARALLKNGYTVTLYDLAPLDAKDLIGKVNVVISDIRDKDKIEKVLSGIDYVVHAAAALPIQVKKDIIFSINIDGTKTVLEASLKNKVKRLVFISSTAVYGVPRHLPETEEAPLDPIGYYGESKIAGEDLCREYMKKGLQINIIRPKTFLGPERLGVLPFQLMLGVLEKLDLSPIAAWHYKTIPVDSYVSIEKAEKLLGWHPKKSNSQLLLESYKWYEEHRNEIIGKKGLTHRVGWNFKILNLFTRF